MKLVKENINFQRCADPKDSMKIGNPSYRFAMYITKKEQELKEKNKKIWNWWESYTGDFWDTLKINKKEETDLNIWKQAYERDHDKCATYRKVIDNLLTLDPKSMDKNIWKWPGPNLRKI